ncbi:hypothetical protein [Sediminicola luteus]|uniref:Uncharacterized protein n=1 Tax=Sediminicola luteus TaxID=319238 RepID=A0A2A4GAD6_9FLAO|nr:hypothetical protein [Sediminicola luteus]PCE64940.1 hypothetical protein B7P33_07220 [Sediminicola luteus]
MKPTSTPQTKAKASVPVAAVMVSIIAFVTLAARFVYVFYNGDSDLEGDFFGFKWLSIFLYNFGVEVTTVGLGALFWVSTMYHPKGSHSRFLFRGVSVGVMAVGFFFMGWIFTDTLYFSQVLEVFMAIIISINATFFSVMLLNYLTRDIRNIKELKVRWLSFLVEIRNEHYKPLLKRIMRGDLYSEAMAEELKKDVKKFDERLRDEAENIVE